MLLFGSLQKAPMLWLPIAYQDPTKDLLGSYYLKDAQGKELAHLCNAKHIRIYYVWFHWYNEETNE